MRRCFATAAFVLAMAAPAVALDMPARKAGLWELKMVFEGRNLPAQVMKQCVDAATDKLMNANFGASNEQNCSKQDMKNVGGTIVVDSVCTFGQGTTTSHAVVSGSFDSAYTVDVSSTRQGGPQIPGMPAESHMKIEAKWLGACATGQKPGDVIMANGMTMNVLELQKMQRSAPPPRRP